jgi:hypothetical protein
MPARSLQSWVDEITSGEGYNSYAIDRAVADGYDRARVRIAVGLDGGYKAVPLPAGFTYTPGRGGEVGAQDFYTGPGGSLYILPYRLGLPGAVKWGDTELLEYGAANRAGVAAGEQTPLIGSLIQAFVMAGAGAVFAGGLAASSAATAPAGAPAALVAPSSLELELGALRFGVGPTVENAAMLELFGPMNSVAASGAEWSALMNPAIAPGPLTLPGWTVNLANSAELMPYSGPFGSSPPGGGVKSLGEMFRGLDQAGNAAKAAGGLASGAASLAALSGGSSVTRAPVVSGRMLPAGANAGAFEWKPWLWVALGVGLIVAASSIKG